MARFILNKMDNKKEVQIASLRVFDRLLEEAGREGVVPEVVLWALIAMKENNSLTTEEALQIGYDEWIK